MKKRISILAVILAVGAFTAVPFVNAEPGPGGRGGHGFGGGAMFFRHIDKLAGKLELSTQQVDQIKAIFADVHEQNAQYREQMKGGLRDATKTLLDNPNAVSAAQAELDAQLAAEKAVRSNMLVATSKALNVLTSEQRAELKTLIEERAASGPRRRR